MASLRWPAFPALWQMASRHAVLLTPLESFHPRLLPSRHLINRVHAAFCKKQPFSFHALAGCHSSNSFLLEFMSRMAGYTPSRQKPLPYLCSSERRSCSLNPFEATLTRYPVSVHSKGTYGIANFFRCNTYKKQGVTPSK
jgi:hypothetical protein